MKKLMITFILLFCGALLADEAVHPKSSREMDIRIDHLVREQFYTLAIEIPVYKRFTAGVEYGYLYYHRAAVDVGYRIDCDHLRPYLKAGTIFQRENFTTKAHYTEWSLKMGGGVEADLFHHLFLNVETSVLNYLMVNYSLRKIKYRETYDFGKTVDYEVVVGLGYRFHF